PVRIAGLVVVLPAARTRARRHGTLAAPVRQRRVVAVRLEIEAGLTRRTAGTVTEGAVALEVRLRALLERAVARVVPDRQPRRVGRVGGRAREQAERAPVHELVLRPAAVVERAVQEPRGGPDRHGARPRAGMAAQTLPRVGNLVAGGLRLALLVDPRHVDGAAAERQRRLGARLVPDVGDAAPAV